MKETAAQLSDFVLEDFDSVFASFFASVFVSVSVFVFVSVFDDDSEEDDVLSALAAFL
jgi:hypothetical protein